jgi:transposase
MVYGAIDLHAQSSEIRIVDAAGAVLRHRKVKTTREQLAKAFEGHGPMRILVEASTESEWVAQALEDAGHEVVVADPNYGPMYGTLRRCVKTDHRDTDALCEANRRGWYRPAHRVSRAQRTVRQRLAIRRQLVRMRTGLISQLRAVLRQEGLRLPSGSSSTVPQRVTRMAMPMLVQRVVHPLLDALTALTPIIARETRELETIADGDPVLQQLQTVPGVGPLVALTFRATLDDPHRFRTAEQASSSVGLVPREDSSGERRQRGHITKVGSSEARTMLIQAAWTCWRSRTCRATHLRRWADALAARRGARIAVVAVARRLSRVLFAMWRDGTTFQAPAGLTSGLASASLQP